MDVAIARKPGERDRIYVHRDDGTEVAWQFPTYGDLLAHDLVHFVVEQELGLTDGFWGLVQGGAHVALVNDEATIVRDGRPLVDDPTVDFSGLLIAEACVAILGGLSFMLPDELPAEGELEESIAHAMVELVDVLHDGGRPIPPGLSSGAVLRIVHRLHELGADWLDFGRRPKGGAINLTW